ncbi:hypothetical protein [Xanthomonas sp. XNM01]|uniref:hypothetical protein n=1 Tax=Xanthomonas sp. XNM01 TaxID=2769289 RepID=UPI00177DF3E1|nr:hypothetical protein [Xanthomonas sp. XNM01]MBD9369277.1 hypothetical protein [Xanthomonas sp. XNM01]
MLRIAAAAGLFGLTLLPAIAQAAPDCTAGAIPQPLPLSATAIAPVAAELGSRTSQLGMPSGVLAPAQDPAQALDRVLLRLRIDGCRNVAKAMPAPAAANPNDPSAYKPQTEFDNTPWRFDMSQGGKRMTADEFDAWMKSRGVRVARGAAAPAAAAQPAAAPAEPAASKD